MSWKNKLKRLEGESDWPKTVDFLIAVVCDHPSEMDSYLYLAYFIMNVLLEEDYDEHTRYYLETVLKNCFDESYEKFSDNAEYLYYMGMIAVMSEWLFDLDVEDYKRMLMKAIALEPHNMLYQGNCIIRLDTTVNEQKKRIQEYANLVLQQNSSIRTQLAGKGKLGEYILGTLTSWAKYVLSK